MLWRGVTRNFAQSSGTSDGKSKYVPITKESFSRCHYRGGVDCVALYLAMNPQSRIFDGKAFILGGSYANELHLRKDVVVGDLSANLINNINPLANLVRIPDKQTALMEDWSKKLPALVEASRRQNVTNISGVPSWFLSVIKEVMRREGVESIHDVWHNLEVFFHGGISFKPYRSQYESITDKTKMHFVETYNASEGFFAVQSSPDSPAMLLLLDLGARVEGYCADITRTYPISGKYSPRQKEIYDIVLRANRAVAEAARPGVTLRELNDLCKKVLAEGMMAIGKIQSAEEIGRYYMHGVSHHLGLDTHDCAVREDLGLRAGMVISDEPGLYIDEEEIGIRIEDDLLITDTGCRVLSEAIPRTTEEIEALMAR